MERAFPARCLRLALSVLSRARNDSLLISARHQEKLRDLEGLWRGKDRIA